MDPAFSETTVAVFLLPPIEGDLKCTHLKQWVIKDLADIELKLRKTKSMIDKPYADNPKKWSRITRELEPSWPIATRLRRDMPRITNAGSKIYELINTFHDDIFKEGMQELVHFDNAAMPGMFPYTINYYVKSRTKIKYTWYASSLVESTHENSKPLKDSYNLLANYPKNWIMDEKNNGDVMDIEVQKFFSTQPKVDLYTSDIGFDVSVDYNEQETIHSPVNLGQIVSGLLTLKEGGCLITKQYTFYTGFTISLMGYLTKFFDKLYVVKPLTSKPDNSETYLVGVGFKGLSDLAAVEKLMNLLPSARTVDTNGAITPMMPITQKGCISNAFIRAIIASNTHFSTAQIAKICLNLHDYRLFKNKKPDQTEMKKIVERWFSVNAFVSSGSKNINLNTGSIKSQKFRR